MKSAKGTISSPTLARSTGPPLGVPGIPAAGVAASVSLAAYVVETIGSLQASLNRATPSPTPPSVP